MLFEESTIGLALCRMNGDLIDINPAFASILGRTIEETMKLSYWDITPEKYTREEQRQLELLEQTGQYGPAVDIAHVSLDGAFQRINRRFCDMLGYSKEEMFSKTFQGITHPDDLEADLDYVRQMLAAEIEFYSMEKRYICKDQSVIWVNLTVAIQNDEKGTPKYFVSAVENITERKQAEEALRSSEQKYRSVVENIGIGVSVISRWSGI